MVIRDYRSADFERFREMNFALQEFERRLEPTRCYWEDFGERYSRNAVDQHERAGCEILLLECDGGVNGFITFRIEISNSPIVSPAMHRHLYIQDIYLEPEFRRQGHGKRLLDAVASFGKAEGVGYAVIGALHGNADAHNAYCKAGFQYYEVKLKKLL